MHERFYDAVWPHIHVLRKVSEGKSEYTYVKCRRCQKTNKKQPISVLEKEICAELDIVALCKTHSSVRNLNIKVMD